MRLNPCLKSILLGGAVVSLTACSYIADLFPDKQKQYRYSSELPDLEIPPDLDAPGSDPKDSSALALSKRGQSADADTSDTKAKSANAGASSAQSKGKKHKPVQHNESSMTLAESMQNAALIEMQEPLDEAWNDVGRALGRLRLEISDQNRSDGVYYVYYGGVTPKKDTEDTSWWDDVSSVFSGNKDQAKEFRIKLDNKDTTTNVYIVDPDGNAISEGPGLDLLKKLHKKLITLDQPDTPDTGKDEPKADPEEVEKP